MRTLILSGAVPLLVGGCGNAAYDARGVDHEETLLSVSTTGEAESRPDEAQFQAGINTWARNAKAATAANHEQIDEIVAALKEQGIPEDDIQTRTVSIQRIDWGDRKGQFQASNVVNVTVRNVHRAGEAVTAVTDAGANLMSGPDLRMADPETTANLAYAQAFKAARARADAYAQAANMEISRVLTIRDAGGSQGSRYLPAAMPPPPPPPPARMAYPQAMVESVATMDASGSGRIMPGQTTSAVAIQVDFALRPK